MSMAESNIPANLQELEETIIELEEYRERLVHDMTNMAQRAKITKSQMMANLEPDLNKIDQTLEQLRNQKTALTGTN